MSSNSEAKRNMNLLVAAVPPWCVFGAATVGSLLTGLFLSLKFTQEDIGYAMSLTLLFLPMQLIGTFIQERFFNRKKFWIVTLCIAYALFGTIGTLTALQGVLDRQFGIPVFLFLFGAAHFFMQMPGAVQVAWWGEVIPPQNSNTFWTRRTATATICTLICGLTMGFLADMLGREKSSTYAMLLGIGVLFAFLSVSIQTKVPDIDQERPPVPKLLPLFRDIFQEKNFRRLMLFFAIQSFGNWLMCGLIFVYLQTTMDFSQFAIQILLAISGIIGFFSGYFFRFFGNRFGRRPLMLICSALKAGEFCLWGTLLSGNNWLDEFGFSFLSFFGISSSAIPAGFIGALPVFIVGGFVNMGLVAGQMSLLTSTGKKETQSVKIGLFFTILGLAGAVSSYFSGILSEFIGSTALPEMLGLTPFNILSFGGALCYLISILFMISYHESGAVPTVRVVKCMLAHNPFRAIYHAYVLETPLPEFKRQDILKHATSELLEDKLLQSLYSPSEIIRESALNRIEESKNKMTPAIQKELIFLLNNPQYHLHQRASVILGKNGCSEALPELLKYINDSDAVFANSCIFSVGLLQRKEALEPLLSLLNNNARKEHWATAAEAVSRMGNYTQAETLFLAYENQTDWVLSQQCLIAVCRIMQGKPEEIFSDFESEYQRPASALELLIEQLPNVKKSKSLRMELLNLLERKAWAEIMESILRSELTHMNLPLPEQLADLTGGTRLFRIPQLNGNAYSAVSFRLQFRLWGYLVYAGEQPDNTKLLAGILLARQFFLLSETDQTSEGFLQDDQQAAN